jgi:hypothetical protein
MAAGAGQDSPEFIYDDLNRVQLCTQRRAESNYNDYDPVNNLKSISRREDDNKGEVIPKPYMRLLKQWYPMLRRPFDRRKQPKWVRDITVKNRGIKCYEGAPRQWYNVAEWRMGAEYDDWQQGRSFSPSRLCGRLCPLW